MENAFLFLYREQSMKQINCFLIMKLRDQFVTRSEILQHI